MYIYIHGHHNDDDDDGEVFFLTDRGGFLMRVEIEQKKKKRKTSEQKEGKEFFGRQKWTFWDELWACVWVVWYKKVFSRVFVDQYSMIFELLVVIYTSMLGCNLLHSHRESLHTLNH